MKQHYIIEANYKANVPYKLIWITIDLQISYYMQTCREVRLQNNCSNEITWLSVHMNCNNKSGVSLVTLFWCNAKILQSWNFTCLLLNHKDMAKKFIRSKMPPDPNKLLSVEFLSTPINLAKICVSILVEKQQDFQYDIVVRWTVNNETKYVGW